MLYAYVTVGSSLPRWILLTLVAKPREHMVSHVSSSLGLTWTSIKVFESDPARMDELEFILPVKFQFHTRYFT